MNENCKKFRVAKIRVCFLFLSLAHPNLSTLIGAEFKKNLKFTVIVN